MERVRVEDVSLSYRSGDNVNLHRFWPTQREYRRQPCESMETREEESRGSRSPAFELKDSRPCFRKVAMGIEQNEVDAALERVE